MSQTARDGERYARAVRVLLLVFLAACGARPAPPSRTITDDESAIVAFKAGWEREVRPRIADPLVRRIDNRMQTTDALGRYHAQPHECREGIDRIRGLTDLAQHQDSPDGRNLVVHGTPDALLGRAHCWSVLFMGGVKLAAEGWLDASGRLLIVWRVPAS